MSHQAQKRTRLEASLSPAAGSSSPEVSRPKRTKEELAGTERSESGPPPDIVLHDPPFTQGELEGLKFNKLQVSALLPQDLQTHERIRAALLTNTWLDQVKKFKDQLKGSSKLPIYNDQVKRFRTMVKGNKILPHDENPLAHFTLLERGDFCGLNEEKCLLGGTSCRGGFEFGSENLCVTDRCVRIDLLEREFLQIADMNHQRKATEVLASMKASMADYEEHSAPGMYERCKNEKQSYQTAPLSDSSWFHCLYVDEPHPWKFCIRCANADNYKDANRNHIDGSVRKP